VPSIAGINYLVRDVDEALAYFAGGLGFDVLEDDDSAGRRRVVVAPPESSGAALVLKLAETDEQRAAVGGQGGGVVLFFLETDDFERDHTRMRQAKIAFREEPRHEAYGTVAVFEDLYGNAWDLIQPA
jgi:catechol 2,3-dioxygenase-like lactoylglutathione lyase family enzyme